MRRRAGYRVGKKDAGQGDGRRRAALRDGRKAGGVGGVEKKDGGVERWEEGG